jgi:hypothetical protein
LPVYEYARQNSSFIRILLTEPWMRQYQTLPGRLHPCMKMSGSGGYLLSMIYVGGDQSVSLQIDSEQQVGEEATTFTS